MVDVSWWSPTNPVVLPIFRLWLPLFEEQDRLLGDVSDTQC